MPASFSLSFAIDHIEKTRRRTADDGRFQHMVEAAAHQQCLFVVDIVDLPVDQIGPQLGAPHHARKCLTDRITVLFLRRLERSKPLVHVLFEIPFLVEHFRNRNDRFRYLDLRQPLPQNILDTSKISSSPSTACLPSRIQRSSQFLTFGGDLNSTSSSARIKRKCRLRSPSIKSGFDRASSPSNRPI